MRVSLKILVVAVAVTAAASGALTWAPGPRPKPTKCPWPPCTATCDPANQGTGYCIEKDGTFFESSFECCCCTPEAKHRSMIGPR